MILIFLKDLFLTKSISKILQKRKVDFEFYFSFSDFFKQVNNNCQKISYCVLQYEKGEDFLYWCQYLHEREIKVIAFSYLPVLDDSGGENESLIDFLIYDPSTLDVLFSEIKF